MALSGFRIDEPFKTLSPSPLVPPCSAPLRTPRDGEERHATWLELFYDLMVVAVSQVARALSEDHSALGMLMIAGLSIPMFWVSVVLTVYNLRGLWYNVEAY